MNVKLAISSCPNDTFSFYHFIHNPPEGISIKPVYLDIEELNLGLLQGKWDIVKASFPAAAKADQYELMQAGSALGFGVGPIVLYKDETIFEKKRWKVGLPGKNTTAHFLWNYFIKRSGKFTDVEFHKEQMHFAAILDKLGSGEIDAGVVIHEGRFVYRERGLKLLQDLGEFWETKAKAPVPLGGIFIRKDIDAGIRNLLEEHLKKSVNLALEEKNENANSYNNVVDFMKKHSQELSLDVMEKHIDYYVNKETQSLSDWGKMAVDKMRKELETYETD